MRKKLLPILFILFAFLMTELYAQEKTAKISGSVFLPAKKKTVKRRRGLSYRSRHRQHKAKEKKSAGKSVDSPFLDVIVSLHPLSFKAPVNPLEKNAIIYQYQAKFYPHVIPVTPGTKIDFINKDNIYHNVFSVTPGAKFNIGRRPKGEVSTRRIDILGEVKLFCDIHSHMNAFILSLDTPYFTRVNNLGKYSLDGIPPGVYEIRVYHPNFEQWVEKIEINADDELTKNFRLSD